MTEELKHTSEKKLTAKEKVAKETGFWLIKSIRQYPDPYAFWRHEAISLTRKKTDKKRPVRFGGENKKYTLRIDGDNKVKANPLYDEDTEKGRYSKNKSMTAISTEHKLCPDAFSFNRESWNNVEVGYMMPAKPEYVLIRRIFRDAGGTIHRTYRYDTPQEAKKAWENGLKDHTMFTTLGDLAKHGDAIQPNEVMAHAKWGPEARIAYFKDNLPSKLRAISLAYDMSRRLEQQKIDNEEGDSKFSSPADTKKQVPDIYSYLPHEWIGNTAKIDLYTPTQQEEDITKGLKSIHLRTRAFARFVQLQKNGFVKQEGDHYSARELEIFIKLAADLTYESSILFFEKFFLPDQHDIQDKLHQAQKTHVLRDVYRCVPLERRTDLVYPLLTTPQLRGYYLHSLLKYDFLEDDVEEFFKQLESKDDIDFTIEGEYYQDNRLQRIVHALDRNENTLLHLAASNNKIAVAQRLISNNAAVNAKNKDGKTPLDLAFESGHMQMYEFLKQKKATHRDFQTSLHIAILNNDLKSVKKIISESKEKKDINARGRNGLTPLHLAAKEKNLELVEYLLEQGATINSRDAYGRTPLSQTPSLSIAKLLLEKGALSENFGSKKMFANAVEQDQLVSADFLIGRDRSLIPNMQDFRWDHANLLYKAIVNKNDAMVDFLLAQYKLPFPSLFHHDNPFKITARMMIVLGIGFGIYELASPQATKELVHDFLFKEPLFSTWRDSTDSGSLALQARGRDVLFLAAIACLCCIVIACLKGHADKKRIQKTINDKVIEYRAKKGESDSALKNLNLGNDLSAAGVSKHLETLSPEDAATTLLKIADVDLRHSLFVIIRLFNSNEAKASELLWQISQLQHQNKQTFLKLFENTSSNEQAVIVSCMIERMTANNKQQALDIFNMFSSQTKENLLDILEALHPRYHDELNVTPNPNPLPQGNSNNTHDEEVEVKKHKNDDFPEPGVPLSSSRDALFSVIINSEPPVITSEVRELMKTEERLDIDAHLP